PAARGWRPSTPRRESAPTSPVARRSASSAVGATCSRRRCAPTSRWCAPRVATATATSSTAAARATSIRRWAPPPASRSPRAPRSPTPAGLDPEAVVTPGAFVDRVVACERPLDAAAIRELSRRWGRLYDLEVRERTVGPTGIPPDLMVRRVARLLHPGEYVNLGLGLPTLL